MKAKLFLLAAAIAAGSFPASAQLLYNWTGASGSDVFWATPGNWSPAGPPTSLDTAWFNNNATTNGTGPGSVNNILAVSRTIRALQYSNNVVGLSHNTVLNPGVTLTISNNASGDNNLLVGTGLNLAGPVTNTLSGTGAKLVVTNALGNISLRSTSGGNTGQNTVFDLSGLDTFNAGVARLLIGSDAFFNREVGTLLLAKTNVIVVSGTTPQISLGDQPSNGVGGNNDPTLEESFLYLGQTNAIFADSITVGREKSSGAMLFNPVFTNSVTPAVFLRGTGASRVATFSVSDQSALGSSNQRSLGLVDFSGGIVDAMISTANIGLGKNGNNTATSPSEVGTLTFSSGTIDINTLNIGSEFVVTSTGPGPVGTVNVNGTAALVVNTAVNMAKLGASLATPPVATLNVNGGTATFKGPVVSAGGTSTLVFNGGVLNAAFSGVTIGTLAAPISSVSFSNTILNLAPTFTPTNIVTSALTTFAGATNTINFVTIPSITSYPAQLPLIQFSTPPSDLTTFVLGSLPSATPPYQGYVTNDGVGQVYLLLTNGPVGTPLEPQKADVWNGAPIGNWDTTTKNWISSGTPTNYANVTTAGAGDTVTFDDTLTGTTNVNLTTTLSPGSITVNNTSENYIFSGSGKLTGATGLAKQGTATLTLKETGGDNYSGVLSIANGTLIIDNDSSAVTGGTLNAGVLQIGNNDGNGVPPAGILTNNGTLIFNRSDNGLLVPNVISGTGTLIQNGPGTVTFSGVSTFTGPTIVNGGTLAAAGPNNNPSALTSSSGLTINNGGTVLVTVDNGLAGSNGKLPITINAGGTLTGLASLNGGAGASSHIAGLLTLNGGTLTDNGTQILGNGSWDLDGGVTVPGGPITSTISALSVIPTQGGGTVFNITNGGTPSGIDLNITGTLVTGTGSSVKTDAGFILNGNGTMVLGGSNTYIGPTVINGGILRLNNSNAAQNSTVTLNEDNGIQFGANVGTFAFGGLAGLNSFALMDISNHPVTLQVGRNNATTSYTGVIGGSGALMKMGTGTLALGGTNLYTGITTISNGTLQLLEPASLSNSPLISLIAPTAILDVGGRVDDTLTVPNTQALIGNGTVSGFVTNFGLVSPGIGGTTGVLTVANGVTLLGTTAMKIDKADATNDLLVTFGPVAYGGTLAITNLNTPLAVNDSFQLFSAGGGFTGAFSAIIPASPGSGMSWDTNSLAVDGTLRVAIGPVTGPSTNANITRVSLSGTNLLVHGTNNNVPNTNFHYLVLTTTNLATALSNWTPVVTNLFNSDGTFDYTNPIVPGTSRQFIDVEAVP